MELFQKAQTIRLRSHKDKYLIAGEDEESVFQDRDGSANNSLWTVEFVVGRDVVRLKSCYGKYLTATNILFLPKVTGKKVLQTVPNKMDARTEWEPIADGFQVRLKTLWGYFLRPNGGLPPWRNSVTHDIPHRNKTRDKILWDVEIVETRPTHRRTTSDMSFNRSTSVSASASLSWQKPKGTRSLQDFI